MAVAAVAVAALLVGDLRAASPKQQLAEKQAQERRVLDEVQALDRQFGATVEAWNGARYELSRVRVAIVADRASLRVAQRQRDAVQRDVRERLVALYESDSQPTALSIILGSDKLGDMIDELAAAQQVAAADRNLAHQAKQARDRFAAHLRVLRQSEHRRATAVMQLASQRAQIGSMLQQRRTLLASISAQMVALRAEEARRQAALAAAARERLAREQALLRQQAAERAAAARRARARPAPPVTPATTTTTAAEPPPATTTAPAPPPTTSAQATTTTTEAAPPAPPAPAPSAAGGGHPEAATIALRYLGVRYQWGGATPAGFDCSGLVMYVYAQLGVSLPHYAAAQYQLGQPVSRAQLQPGDLVFFDGLNHVGIYIGGGQVVHAPQTGDVVKISSIADWGAGYVGARRI